MFNFTDLPWSWVEMCGPKGLVPWYPSKKDIGNCFQQIYLQVPVLLLFAIMSAYYYGARMTRQGSITVYRKWTIRARLLCCIGIAIVPIIKAIIGSTVVDGMFRPVDYLTSGVELIAWCVHTGYVHSLRHRPKVHGPVFVRVLWTLTAVLSVINIRSLALDRHDLPTDVSFYCGVAVVVLQILYGLTFLSTLFVDDRQPPPPFNESTPLIGSYFNAFREDVDPGYLGVAAENSNTLSKLVFYWVYPLLKKGADNKLRENDDLYDLPSNLTTSSLSAHLQTAIYGDDGMYSEARPRMGLIKALHKCFGLEFYAIGILKFIADVLGFGGPLILNRLVTFVEEKNEDYESGYKLAAILFIITLFGAFLNAHFTFCMSRVGLKMRGALISLVYKKTLSISFSSVNRFTMGEIVNFMSTDTDRIVNACPSFHTFWSIPLQIAISFYLLYQQVGISFLAGVAFTLVLIPVNKCIANKIGKLSSSMMAAKDERVSIMSEILRGMRVIKLHVWEAFFMNQVNQVRETELKYLRGRKYLDALCVYFWASTPVLVSILTLGTFVLLGNPLSAATVFTTVALLNMLIGPLNAFPWVLNGLVESWVSVKRIEKLIDAPNMDLRDYYASGPGYITLTNLSAEWDPPEDPESGLPSLAPAGLQNVSLQIEAGQLVGVIGDVGSGKSTLLHALLGELTLSLGEIAVVNWEGGFGFVAQSAWLQHGTIRDNILFGKSYDSTRYRAVLDACCLTDDLAALHGGDMARVGEGGTTLSGGQKARVALARAVYQEKDVYLLDDILAALDPAVARSVFSKVVLGLLKEKTRIMCTSNVDLLSRADQVIVMSDGRVKASGPPADMLQRWESSVSETESMLSYKESKETDPDATVEEDPEISATGAVKASIYRRYWSSVGSFLAISIFFSLLLMQSSRNVTDYWLSVWVSASNTTLDQVYELHGDFYLFVYISLAISNTFFTLIRAFLFAYGGLTAAAYINDRLFVTSMHAKMTFFDCTPLGRILNRFSSDTYTVDDSLPFIANILLAQVFGLVGSLAITIYGLPWLCVGIAPLVPMYHYLQSMYRPCARELKRLSSTTLSPLYSHFNETLQGIVTIRAFRSLSRFQQRNEEYLENNQRALFAGYAANSWLGLRLQLMGVAIVTGVVLVAVIQHQFDVIAPALVGLVVAYALSITSLLSGVVSAFAETEREFVALERIDQYIEGIDLEDIFEYRRHPPCVWPSLGVVNFQGVYLRYRPHLAPSLNGISFETQPAEKIGVVGRTGAGKSSLIAALLRLVEMYSGTITIDTVNINDISIPALRSRIAVIPQDPYLFKGTLQSNLDPLGEFKEQDLWIALKKCQLKEKVERLGGLRAHVEVNGRNFSQGQRQLICLARAVLKNSKIVCVDEATASVDQETDRCIQQTIRSCFRQSTVLTIAHRISTVMDCDRLLVLRDGEVVEFDTPQNLASDPHSYFSKLSNLNQ